MIMLLVGGLILIFFLQFLFGSADAGEFFGKILAVIINKKKITKEIVIKLLFKKKLLFLKKKYKNIMKQKKK